MRIFVFAFACILSIVAVAQKGEVRGFVYNKKTGEPIPFANVFLRENYQGTSTDEEGLYVITKANPGKYHLVARALGYDSVSTEIVIQAGKIVMKNILLTETGIDLGEVNISAERQKSKKTFISQLPTLLHAN